MRFLMAATAALSILGSGAALAQSGYPAPYAQQPYPQGYAQPQVLPQANPYAPANRYPQGYASPYGQGYAAPYGQPAYGTASYVQPSYGSPYSPQAGDPFPEQPAQGRYQQPDSPTVIVSGGGVQTLGGAASAPPAAPLRAEQPARSQPVPAAQPRRAEPAAQPIAAQPIAVEPPPATPAGTMAAGSMAAGSMAGGRPQAPAGTFDELYAARHEQPQVAQWEPDPQEGYGGWLSELRFGVLEHDAGLWSGKKEDGLDINGEILFTSPAFLDFMFSPRPTIGGTIHTEGEINVVYLGLTWEWNVTPWLYLEAQWGPAFHDGNLTGQTADKKGYGCPVLSRVSAGVGVRYEHHSLQAFYSHMSNGDICEENDGLDTAGIRYGYRF
ncbi:MAG: acyloxyacyl hydrolase [Tistlia sp.]